MTAPVPVDAGQRRTLVSACVAHAMHDGFIDGILIFLPVFQAQFGRISAAVGLLRARFIAMSVSVAAIALAIVPLALALRRAFAALEN